jgi:hypothetical protein
MDPDTHQATLLRPAGVGRSWLQIWRRSRLRRRLLLVLPALVPALLFLPAVLAPPLNHDVAAVLQFSQRWVAGEHLNSDLIDVNPPLIFVLNLGPAALAALTGLDAVVLLQICLFTYGALCWFLAVRVRLRATEGAAERAYLDVLPLLFLLCAGYDFGQREHLMALAALPYVFCAQRRARGERARARIAISLIAGLAFALKPHFLAVPALVELAVFGARTQKSWAGGWRLALRQSLRDPVPWVLACVWLSYLAALPLLFPEYLGVVVPLVWDLYLSQGGLNAFEVLLVPRMGTVLCLLAPLLWLAFRQPILPGNVLPRLLGLAAIGALAAALVQHKAWSYHILPIELFSCALAGVLTTRWLDRLKVASPGPYRIASALAGLFALYAIANGEAPWKEIAYANSQAAGLTTLLRQVAAGERVLVLSPGVYPIFPALNYADIHATLRTMNMWMLEGAYDQCLANGRRYREVWEMGRAEFFVFRTVAEDFARAPPEAVLVDRTPGIPWCGEEFDFVRYFIRHPLFAEVWSHYQLTAEWDRYRLYTRKD